ncbi:MAG TPA: hypothetical protein VIV58_03535 [Kofleriaceae bacterium]
MGNNLPSVAGTIDTRDPIAVSGLIDRDFPRVTQAREKSGPRYPRAHLQLMPVTKR